MDQIPCPDGYLLDARSPIAEGHHALNQYLVRVEEAGWSTALKEVNGIRDKRRKLLTWRALLERMLWLRDNNPRCALLSPLRGLAERIEKWTLAPTEADLIQILDRTADAAGFLAPYTPMPHLMKHVETNGLTPELAAAIREFRARVYDDCLAVNQVSLQMFRSRLDMLGWRDEWTPIDLKRCWSEQVRADFRAMSGEEKENWRQFLYSIHGDEGTRPAPRWMTEANALIRSLGSEAFNARLSGWLAPLSGATPQRLSREGSYLLRSFVWLASKDDRLREVAVRLQHVVFKPKANGNKVVRAAAELAGMPDPTLPPTSAATTFEDLTARTLSAVVSSASTFAAPGLAERVEIGPDIVYVRGKVDAYELHISGGAIFRRSDGRRVHIAAPLLQNVPAVLQRPGGVTDVMRNVLILVDDDKNVAFLSTSEG